MALDFPRARQYLKNFDLEGLFIDTLGWDRHSATMQVNIGDDDFTLTAIAHKRGMVAFRCSSLPDGRIPDRNTRRRIDRQVAKSVHEHFIVFLDANNTHQIWQWVRKEIGKPAVWREHHYHINQSGDALLQKLQHVAFTLEDEETLTLPDVLAGWSRAGVYAERVTKRFYDRFKAEHATFLKFIKGIPDEALQRWYASVMLNRLMFIYFIQKKGFLDGNPNYLANKLAESKQRGKDRYYREFLCPLFFEGFAKKPQDRSPQAKRLLGNVPYLNGGIFMPHQVEQLHGSNIHIPDAAFDKLFAFFDQYRWHLDERPLRADNEINPDVLGYIFEKYINQKELGAYYTKEDITEYIAKNTIIPRLFDMAREKCRVAFEGDNAVWQLLQADPDRYIYPAVRHGVVADDGSVVPEADLPDFVQKGMHDPKARMFDKRYNLQQAPADDPIRLPTETWREYVERRKRCLEVRQKLAAGEVREINDLITLNLDIRQFAQDVIENCEGPDLLNAFWKAIESITVLDPAVGSGAFLFAALNILEPLYEACLDRMEAFLEEWGHQASKRHPNYTRLFTTVLQRVQDHPNRNYFVFKTIIVNNLYGVDIMEEAVEICKLRLFLKLAAQVDPHPDQPNFGIEPLPDIDFNIRAGNSLVGYATYDQVKQAIASELDFEDKMDRIRQKAEDVDRLFALFRQQQTQLGGQVTPEDKQQLRNRLEALEDELNDYLAGEYGIDPTRDDDFQKWRTSHKPFHWFIEFYGIMKHGGFDVVIGNPPYVSSRKARQHYDILHYSTHTCPDIYAWFVERASSLGCPAGRVAMILPLSCTFSSRFSPLRQWLFRSYEENWFSSFGRIPSALFAHDVRVRNTIHMGAKRSSTPAHHTTRLHRWFEAERPSLFPRISYARFDPHAWGQRIPKLNTQRLIAAFETRLRAPNHRIATIMSTRPTPWKLHFKKTAYNWLTFCRRLPPCYDSDGRPIRHTKFGQVYFHSAKERDLCFVVLNGKIQFAFWIAIGDDFDLTQWMFAELPIDPMLLSERAKAALMALVPKLESAMQDALCFKLNAGRKVGNYNLAKCRHVTDESDQILARELGFEGVWDDIELLCSQVIRTNFDDSDQ